MCGSETWPLKLEQEVKLDRNKMSMMCGSMLKERKNNTALRELLGLEPTCQRGNYPGKVFICAVHSQKNS